MNSQFSKFLKDADTRDKVLKTVQYIAKLTRWGILHFPRATPRPAVVKGDSADRLYTFASKLSAARGIFRTANWTYDVSDLINELDTAKSREPFWQCYRVLFYSICSISSLCESIGVSGSLAVVNPEIAAKADRYSVLFWFVSVTMEIVIETREFRFLLQERKRLLKTLAQAKIPSQSSLPCTKGANKTSTEEHLFYRREEDQKENNLLLQLDEDTLIHCRQRLVAVEKEIYMARLKLLKLLGDFGASVIGAFNLRWALRDILSSLLSASMGSYRVYLKYNWL